MQIFIPGTYSGLNDRLLLGLAAIVLLAASYYSRNVRENMEILVYVLFNAVALQWFWFVYVVNLSMVYVAGSMVVYVGLSLCFLRMVPLLIYSGNFLLGSILVSIFCDAPNENTFMLIVGIITIQVLVIANLWARLYVLRKVEEADKAKP